MAPVIKTVTIRGSPAQTTLTDLQPGKQRAANYPLAGTPIAVAWPLIAAGISAVTAYAWGKNSAANEAVGAKKAASLDATINKEWALARKEDAEADAIRQVANDPKGLSRAAAEDIAKRKIGLEERTAEQVQQQFTEEAEFRDVQRSALNRLANERARQLELENDVRLVDRNRAFASELLDPYRQEVERNALELQNMRIQDAQAEIIIARGRATPETSYTSERPSAPLRVPGGIRAIGLGL